MARFAVSIIALAGCPACAAPVVDTAVPETDGYVMLAASARESGWLHVDGLCVPLLAELPEAVSPDDGVALVSADLEEQREIEVIPERVVVVRGLDAPPEAFDIDPDRAVVDEADPSAIAELATRVLADAIPLDVDVPDPDTTHWLFTGPDVWLKLERAMGDSMPVSVHPLPDRMQAASLRPR
jgi:hypothetical protein